MPELHAMEIGDETPTALYRFFNALGKLLYIGITDNLKARFAQHAADKSWWPEVARKTVEWYGSREEAAAAELAAIDAELPVYNIAGSPSPPVKWRPPAPYLPPGAAMGDLAEHISALIRSDLSHAACVLLCAAAVKHGGRLPRGAALEALADECGVSRAMAFRVLRAQADADADITAA